jgi:gliding motility-associated-like protein
LSLGESKKFSIIATELDGDSLSVTAKGRNFNFSELGWTFNPKAGFKSISTDLTFNADCDALRKQNLIQQANVNQLLTADFTVTDVRCGIKQSRTYTMIFKINAEKNEPPKVSTSLATKTVEYNINPQGNNEVKFNVIAEDPNVSQTINLVGTPRGFDFKSADMAFDNKSGKGKLSSVFSWTPSCKSLDGKESKEYFIRFSSVDNSCFTNNNDSLTIKLVLLDKSLGNGDVKPYNVFTPNGDGVNDYFTLGVVPGDNCRRQFKKFEIFNRWGRLIYRTEDRNFRWDGNNNPEGEYMYSLVFSDDTFKGILKIMK